MDALLRFFELALKALGIVSLFFIVPYIVGGLPVMRWKWHVPPGVASAIIFGTVVLWAIFPVIAIPCTIWWGSMNGLLAVVLIVWGVSAGASLVTLGKELLAPLRTLATRMAKPTLMSVLVLTCMLAMTAFPVFLQHRDADDATYVAQVTDAVQTGTLYGHHHYTGAPLVNDDGSRAPWQIGWHRILAPFPLLVACYAKATGIHPAIMSHTVLPGVLIPLAFMVYYSLAKSFFPDPSDHWIFLLILCVAIMFGGYSAWSTGSFLLLRIWQGKAVLATILLPLLFLLLVQEQRQGLGVGLWCALTTVTFAAVTTTNMTSVLAPFLFGAFCLYKCVRTRQIARSVALVCSGAPAIAQGVFYHLLK